MKLILQSLNIDGGKKKRIDMLQILGVFIIVFLLIFSFFLIACEDDYDIDANACSFSWFKWALIISVFMTVLYVVRGKDVGDGFYTETRTKIYSISNPYNSLSGSFVLGSGVVSSSEMYSYFVRVSNNSFRKEYVPTNRTKILLTNEEEPSVIRINCRNNVKIGYIKIYEDDMCREKHGVEEGVSYVLVLPEDSIVQNFHIN